MEATVVDEKKLENAIKEAKEEDENESCNV